MKYLLLTLFCFFSFEGFSQQKFLNPKFDPKSGKLLLDVELDKEILMVSYLSQGVGSNDIGLDRGKIMSNRVVKFMRMGNKVLLIEPNYGFRAQSTTNIAEKRAVNEAFAKSILYGFTFDSIVGNSARIDISSMCVEDFVDVAKTLKDTKQGTYKIEKSRSAIDFDNCHSFPLNLEIETMLTLVGESQGQFMKSVVPTPDIVTVGQHISFAQLPDDNYTPRAYHPYSGYFHRSYLDYSTPINQDIEKRVILRHRLEKKNKGTAPSEAVEPIIYYVDNGCPEPIKSALIEGARWWNQAYEAAGFINAFQVYELPKDAHPLDIRYNIIQWVHRSTRGWSYGATVSDPRTGEIIKGHVSLGSLRVRQDFLLAQGLLSPYAESDTADSEMLSMSIARLRQLSAHEVGHTIGLAHNFAASVNNRASVMDYPHPYYQYIKAKFDLSDAYAVGIGEWDKRAITYGYKEIDANNEQQELINIINETQALGLLYKSDPDSRADNSASPESNLWDNGLKPMEELKRLNVVRSAAIKGFGSNTIKNGVPYSELEKVFVPVYYMHRFQAEAVAKYVGGMNYNYGTKGDKLPIGSNEIARTTQIAAINELLNIISEEHLGIPPAIKNLLYPTAYGYSRTRESMQNKTMFSFDEVSAKEAAISQILELLLTPTRLNRIASQQLGAREYLNLVHKNLKDKVTDDNDNTGNIAYLMFIKKILSMQHDEFLSPEIRIELHDFLSQYLVLSTKNLFQYTRYLIGQSLSNPDFKIIYTAPMLPPGQPIGCSEMHHHDD